MVAILIAPTTPDGWEVYLTNGEQLAAYPGLGAEVAVADDPAELLLGDEHPAGLPDTVDLPVQVACCSTSLPNGLPSTGYPRVDTPANTRFITTRVCRGAARRRRSMVKW